MLSEGGRQVMLRLDAPPKLAAVAVGVHGGPRKSERYRLPDLWQLHLYRYRAALTVGGVRHAIRPGRVSLVPPGVNNDFVYEGRSEHLYAHFRATESGTAQPIPVMQVAGAETPLLDSLLSHAVVAMPKEPAAAQALVWSALWRVAKLSTVEAVRPHPALAAAIAYIESHLAEPLSVAGIARAVDISHNQLTRLFRAETGVTVIAHIRSRRMHRARHLLRESTLPIAAVATSVGINDLQAFNKTCRKELGGSPRAVRAGLA